MLGWRDHPQTLDPVNHIAMEVNQLKRQLKDLAERIHSLRGFL